MKHWYALQSKPHKEDFLWEQLCLRNVEVYYPRIRVDPVNPRSKKVKPYFSGYMFVNVDLEQIGVSSFEWIPGVIRMVSFGNEFVSIPDQLINAIRERVDIINSSRGDLYEKLKPGDVVVLRSGALAGYEAIFDSRLPNTERFPVLLRLLENQQFRVIVPATQISLVGQHQSRTR